MNISELEPRGVFRIFEELCRIPHGSGNTAGISAWCEGQAKRLGLESVRDAAGNVIIYKKGTAGYESCPPVILQGHIDMVCEKTADCPKDMTKDGVTPLTDGEYVFADGTTLGGDNGIAVAYILSVLESEDIPHPPIEALFTVDEETGMDGAKAVDPSLLKGRQLINIDSEEEGILTCGCAGGVRAEIAVPVGFSAEKSGCTFIAISVSGLRGGHSGMEIGRHRINAIKLIGRVLYRLGKDIPLRVCSVSGGGKDNVIPSSAGAVICVDNADAAKAECCLDAIFAEMKKDNAEYEPDMTFLQERTGACDVYDNKSSEKIIFSLMQAPDGVKRMSPHIEGAVMTSLNLGAVYAESGAFKMKFLVRSSAETDKRGLCEELSSLSAYLGGITEFFADYPAWEYKTDSPLRELMINVHRKLYGKEPEVQSIHAGLECGILSDKLQGADMVSMGPDIENAHTPAERMNAASVKRCYEYLLEILKSMKAE